jgi:hypothetical protein
MLLVPSGRIMLCNLHLKQRVLQEVCARVQPGCRNSTVQLAAWGSETLPAGGRAPVTGGHHGST